MSQAKQIKAVGYGRTSSESGEERASLSVQRADFDAMCKAQGWQSLGWFEDKDTSGRCYPVGAEVAKYDTITSAYLSNKAKSKQQRQGLAKALSSGASVLWVRDSTRFARPVSGSMLAPYLRGELQHRNLILWAGNVPVDYSQFATVLSETIKDLSEDHSIKTKTGQSKASIRAKRDKGEVYRNPEMFGFRSGGHGKISPVISELETVKVIYDMFLLGQGLNAIARKLNTEKIPTMSGKAWAFNSVRKVVNRPLYAGYQTDSKGNLVESSVYKPHAVIPLANYDKAQSMLSNNSRPKWQSKYIHPLQGLLFCGYCGHQMGSISTRSIDTKEPQYYYRCDWSTYRSKQDAGMCRKTMIRETLGIPATVEQKKGYLSKEGNHGIGTGLIECLFPFVIPGYIQTLKAKANQGTLESRRTELRLNLDTILSKQTKRYLDKENGLLDDDTYACLAKSLMQEKAQAETELKALEKEIRNVSGFQLTDKDLDTLDGISASEYAYLLRQVVDKVTVFSDKLLIALKDGQAISIERVKDRNSRCLPRPRIVIPVSQADSENQPEDLEPEEKKIHIFYQYKKGEELNTVYDSDDYTILTQGNNNPAPSTIKKYKRLKQACCFEK